MKYKHHHSCLRVFGFLAFLFSATDSAFSQTTPITGDLTVTGGVKSGIGSAAGGTELRLGGLVIAKGSYSGTPTLASSDQGAGTRMLWYPGKSAFRAGSVNWDEWDDSRIGQYSIVLGHGSIASASDSVALGAGSCAYGWGSTAIGGGVATGAGSIALGNGSAATEWGATAMGYGTTSAASFSTSMGFSTSAAGTASQAWDMAQGRKERSQLR